MEDSISNNYYRDLKQYLINDICLINENSLSKQDEFDYIYYLDTGNLTEGVISKLPKLVKGEDKIPSRAKRIVKANDILISTVRPNQEHYGIIKNPVKNMIASTGFAVLSPNMNTVDPEYLYRFLTQEQITKLLHNIAESSTSAYPSIKPGVIGSLKISLPPFPEQKAIANFLSTLDEKIETNNQINKTLEEMAQAIFKHWFVDFEFPNEEGKPYKSSGGKMVESELGLIPNGWEVKLLKDIASMKNGVNYRRNQEGTTVKVVNVRDFDGSTLVNDKRLDEIKLPEKQLADYKLARFDTLVVRSAKPGETLLVMQETNKVYSGFTIRVRSEDHTLKIYTYYCINNALEMLINSSNGTVFKNLNQQILGSLKIMIPEDRIIKAYNNFVLSVLEDINLIIKENERIKSIRDTLLPKLMSGEIRVPLDLNGEEEVEKFVKESAVHSN